MNQRVIQFAVGLSFLSLFALSGCGATIGQQNSAGVASSAGANGSGSHKRFLGNSRNGGQLASIGKVLGIDTTTLTSELKGGKSVFDIAASKGISQQKLISDLESNFKTRLDQMVSGGRISSGQEQQMISKYDSSLPNLISQKGINAWSQQQPFRNNNNTTSQT